MLNKINTPPSTYIVIGLIAGICGANLNLNVFILLLIFTAALFFQRQWSTTILSALLLSIITGYGLCLNQLNNFDNFKNQINNQTFNLTGTVTDYEKNENNLFKHRLTIKAKLLKSATRQIDCNQTIVIYTQKYPKAYVGELVLFKNIKFKLPSQTSGFHNYLIKNNIMATVFTPTLEFEKMPDNCHTISISKYKRQILKQINLKMHANTKVMFNSIFLGYKSEHKKTLNKLKAEFQTWGIVHYLARSGLHLVIISIIWQTVCNLARIPIALSNTLIVLLILLFYLLTWSALPFMRATIMIVGYRLCHLWKLQVHLWHILNLSCALMIITNPISIFFLDFQLSFILTYGLIFFNEISYMKNKSSLQKSVDYRK
jgi:competence protein ComEC